MKSHKYIFPFVVVLTLVSSCKKDFLEVDDNSFINRQSYVKDLKSMEEFLNGNYNMLHRVFYYGLNLVYPDLIADNIKPIVGGTFFVNHYSWTQQAELRAEDQPSAASLAMNASWTTGYRIIRACSFIIEDVDKYRDQNPAKADGIKAQAYALRALVHFQLVNIFAQAYNYSGDGSHPGIPFVTSSNISDAVVRNSVNEVYNGVINDLNAAISLYKPELVSTLYMNSYAAKALLARVYLFKGDYNGAKTLAREVGTVVPIMKNNGAVKMYPDSLFRKGETEALFQLPPSASGVAGSTYNTLFEGVFLSGSQQKFLATSDIATILKETTQDVRNSWVTQSGSNWNISKFPANVVPGFSLSAGSYYQTLLRSSEMYLTAAESYANLNNEDSARYYLDEVRKRANPAAILTSATGPALLDSIYKERRKELSFEGLRMFDLLRWKKGVNRTDAPNQAAKILSYPNNKAIAPLPIPDVNLMGFSQNLDY
ncbi:hypothetical protein A3860_07670 [Niastella vici]|uniref:Carbohydrate-binding protein SusD n=1 Tax=Niastella vici TaxID=1703345 RepID=A0A1V9FIK0_9BACT|nr:RagB/SusD family nutrient uptake outer membrane protein [Niastella vici]OQP58194.1 hypothetical protein A3860_07670 [Niastella vici]